MLEEEMKEGDIREVTLHDGSVVILKNLDKDYNPTSRFEALRILEEAQRNKWMVTGLLFVETDKPSLTETYNLTDTPLNRLTEIDLRPAPSMMKTVNDLMF
jgi:2-oxoglutarate ferredoxin oxidoreductase subunit beta